MIPPVASRFVAGETAAGALDRARELDDRNVGTILNLLGEHYSSQADVEADTDAYLDLTADIDGTSTCISVKPSQIGLDVSDELFAENAGRIAAAAADQDIFLWIDMEDHTTTDATLDVFETLTTRHDGNVGVCVQANLKRTRSDLERLAELPGKVRLVKGAYDEPAEISYKRKERVNEEYRTLMEMAFEKFDDGVGIGSHDPEMIDLAIDLHETYGTGFEIQMLMGVRESAQFELAEEYDVYQYVPYGNRWLSYFYRRAMERKENALFALRAVLGR